MRTDRQVERILDLARRLTGEKYCKRSELADIYGVDPATINRHINVLRSIYCQIEGGRKNGWRINGKSFPVPITPSEIRALELCAELLPLEAKLTLNKLIEKLDITLKDRIRTVIDEDQLLNDILSVEQRAIYDQNFERLETASEDKQIVRAIYRSPRDKQAKEYLLEPYGIFFRGSDWRLFAKSDSSEKKWLQFKILRFEQVEITVSGFEMPSDFVLDQEVEKMWESYGGEQVEIKIKIMPPKSYLVKERIRHPSQEIVDKLPDGAVIVKYFVPKEEFSWWVLSLGANVEVLEPDWFRREVAEEAEEIAGIYR